MAIDLKQVVENKKSHTQKNDFSKGVSLRPWEKIDDVQLQTRTVVAQEAVRRARVIVEKNNQLAESLRSRTQVNVNSVNFSSINSDFNNYKSSHKKKTISVKTN